MIFLIFLSCLERSTAHPPSTLPQLAKSKPCIRLLKTLFPLTQQVSGKAPGRLSGGPRPRFDLTVRSDGDWGRRRQTAERWTCSWAMWLLYHVIHIVYYCRVSHCLTCYLSVSSRTGLTLASDEWTDCVAWQPTVFA